MPGRSLVPPVVERLQGVVRSEVTAPLYDAALRRVLIDRLGQGG